MIKTFDKKSFKRVSENDENDLEFTYGGNAQAFPVYMKQLTSCNYKLFVDTPIGSPSDYRNYFACLDSATENDVVEMHLNTPGGNLTTAIQFRNMIQSSQARVIAICHGEVASAGTLLTLACDEVMVMPHTFFMVHSASYGAIGKQSDLKREVEFSSKYLDNLTKEAYHGFLTEAELHELIENGREFYMGTEEISERLQRKFELDKAEFEEQNAVVEKKSRKSKKKEG